MLFRLVPLPIVDGLEAIIVESKPSALSQWTGCNF